MNKRKVLFVVFLFCFEGLAAYGQSSPTNVEIKLAQIAVKNNEDFSVNTAIRNTGNDEQVLEIWFCGYCNRWIADNPSVHIGVESCLKNSSQTIRLMPGKAFEEAVPVRVELPVGSGQHELVTFRLGIKGGTYGTKWTVSPIWSNAVTVNVTR
jgi:hypothetical protein